MLIHPEDKEIYEFTDLDTTFRLRQILVHFGNDFYNDSDILLRTIGVNDGLPLHTNKHVDLTDDIFYLKLFRQGLVDVKLFHLEYDPKSDIGKEFYRFLQRYKLYSGKSEYSYRDSELGENQYDIKKIVEESYEEFISLLYKSLEIEEEEITGENIDYLLEDRISMEVTIPNGKDFLLCFSKEIFNGDYKEAINIIKEGCNPEKYGITQETLDLDVYYSDYLSNSYLLLIMEYLNITGKIKLENISLVEDFEKRGLFMRFKYFAIVRELEDIFLEEFPEYISGKLQHKIDGDFSEFKDEDLYINSILVGRKSINDYRTYTNVV